jgi:hypothetical protein
MKNPVISNNDYIVYLEFAFKSTFIHCDCFKWNKTVKKRLLEDLEKLSQLRSEPLFAIHEIEDKKHLKFITMMGFEHYMDFIGADNKMRQLFVRKHHGN